MLVLENTYPSAIRRNVAFSEAVYEGHSKVEDMECFLAKNEEEAEKFLQQGKLTMLVDPDCACLERFHPAALVDAILAKRNLGTSRNMAPLTIGLGPGFLPGKTWITLWKPCEVTILPESLLRVRQFQIRVSPEW